MQIYDLVMLGILVAAVLFGAWKGLAWQVASLAAIFASYLIALQFRGPLAQLIGVQPPLNQFIAMFAIYIGASLAIWIGFGFVRSFIERFHLREFDRHAGAVLGALKGALLCIVVTVFAVTLLGETRRTQICQSKSGLLIARSIHQLRGVMPQEIQPILAPYLNQFNEAMTESNSEYARQPNLPTLRTGQGSDLGTAVRNVVGDLFATDNPGSKNQVNGSFQGLDGSQPATSPWGQSQLPNQPPQAEWNLGAVKGLFETAPTQR